MRPLRPLPPTVLALALGALVLGAPAAGCKVAVDFNGTHFTCGDGKCPDGYDCVAGTCVQSVQGADAHGGIDATPGTPDAAIGAPDANLTAVCDAQFGGAAGAAGYMLCASGPDQLTAGATSCEFYATTNGANCDTTCSGLAGHCLDAWNADAPNYCTRLTNDGCATTHTDQLCICSTAPL